MTAVTAAALDELEALVQQALANGDESALQVLGYGEISTVVAYGDHACKRLPPFPSRPAFEAYADTFHAYLDALRTRGCHAVDSELLPRQHEDGSLSLWCVQPLQRSESLLPAALRNHSAPTRVFEQLVSTVMGTIDHSVGLDAQASNWVLTEDQLAYIDVTTPMLRSAGEERLDTDLFLASLPWALRGAVRALVLRQILDKYYDPRAALLDFAGNLFKERLGEQVDAFLAVANPSLSEPISLDEAHAYYRADARLWATLQRLRRLDRWWQRTIRRRVYPFLLPGPVER